VKLGRSSQQAGYSDHLQARRLTPALRDGADFERSAGLGLLSRRPSRLRQGFVGQAGTVCLAYLNALAPPAKDYVHLVTVLEHRIRQ